ncbi:hypothetical protein ACOSQ3_023041 [Xanthoceras sorbifolium]
MFMFSKHLTSSVKDSNDREASHTSYPTGICFSVSLSDIFSSNHLWIVDSGATRHICSQLQAFISLKAIHHVTVTSPNHVKIPVQFAGDIRLSSNLVLKDVLFVPQFKINLISVSALISGSSLTVQFLNDCCVIQEILTKKMIGRGDCSSQNMSGPKYK